MRNQFLTVAINSRRTDLNEKRNHRSMLLNELAEVAFMKRFISNWANSGYQAALDSLPQDDLSTTDVDESVSIEDLEELANELFGEDFFPDDRGEADEIEQWLQENEKFVKERVLTIYGKVRSMDMQISGIETDLKNLEAIQKQDGKKIA